MPVQRMAVSCLGGPQPLLPQEHPAFIPTGAILLLLLLLPASGGQCPAPEHQPSAKPVNLKEQEEFPIGVTLKYECRPGYSGRPFYLTCLPHGAWSSPANSCKRKLCATPPDLTNGRVDIPDGIGFGSTITFVCDTGFRLMGEPSATCTLRGKSVFWDQDPPSCESIPCGPPPAIAHGNFLANNREYFSFGSAVKYHCKPRMTLVGPQLLYCTSTDGQNGVWNAPAPYCLRPYTCAPPAVENGVPLSELKSEYVEGDTVTLQCQPGFAIRGPSRVQCEAQHTWKPELPTCSRMCPQPPDIPHGEHTAGGQDQFSPGQEVTYRCQPGYDLSGAAFLHCTAGGTWSPAAPRCTGRPCPDFPGPLPNGRLLRHRGLQLGAQVTFSCDEGFHLRGSAASHCVLVGGRSFWNSSLPVCERILCPRPPDVPHGSHSGEALLDFAYGTEVAYTCGSHPDTGAPYLLVGEPTLRCLGDSQGRGVWSGPGPRCDPPPPADLPLVCPPPPEMLNGHRIGQQEGPFLPGMTVQYSCSPGFRLAGHNTIFCTHRGTWSQPSLSCQEVNCSLPQFLNGLQKDFEAGKVYHYGDNVTLHCEEGFSREGSPWSQCLEDSWTPPLASCVPRPGDSFLVGMTAGVALFLLPVIIACGVMARCRKSSNEYGKCRDVTIHLHPQEDSERVQPQTEHTAQENRGVCGMAAAMQADSPQLSPD